jgi:hypothetical protein
MITVNHHRMFSPGIAEMYCPGVHEMHTCCIADHMSSLLLARLVLLAVFRTGRCLTAQESRAFLQNDTLP